MTPRRLLGLALGAWCVAVGLGLLFGSPLTHDEASYALLARGVDVDWLYRPRGVVALAHVGIALGGSDLALRLPSTVLGLGFVMAVAALGTRVFGAWVGAWAAALVAGAHPFVLAGAQLLGDLPSATCLLLAVTLLVAELGRPSGPRARLVTAGPLLAAAFYFRYGSAPVIALIVAAALVAWWPVVRARPAPVLGMLAALGGALVPFAYASHAITGSVVGILVLSRKVASPSATGEGLQRFVLGNPFVRYGALLPPVLLAGLVAIVRPPPARRAAWFLWAVAVGQILTIGLIAHGEPRYIFFALALLVCLGVDGIARALVAHPVAARRVVYGAAGLVAASSLVVAGAQPYSKCHASAILADMLADAAAIRADAAGRPCTTITPDVPQLMWYAGCSGEHPDSRGAAPPFAADRRWYTASSPARPLDAAAVAEGRHVVPVALPNAPSAWWLRPR